MIGKVIGAMVGRKIAGRYNEGGRGMIVGALAPIVARRAFGPLGIAVAGGWAAKKFYDHRKLKKGYREAR